MTTNQQQTALPAASKQTLSYERRSKRELRKQQASKNRNTIAYIILIIGAVAMVFPFAYQLIMSLSTYSEITSPEPVLIPEKLIFSNYKEASEAFPIFQQAFISTVVTLIRVSAHVLLCSLAGYAFARMEFKGRAIIFGIMLSILMIPQQVYLLPQYTIIQSLGLLNSIPGIVLPGLFSAFGTFLMAQTFRNMPREFEEAARLDGAGPVRIFFQVMLPLAGPGVSALAVTSTLWSWNELLWPLVIMSDPRKMPLSVGLANMNGLHFTNYGPLMAASLMAMAPILIIFVLLQRRVINGLASSGLK